MGVLKQGTACLCVDARKSMRWYGVYGFHLLFMGSQPRLKAWDHCVAHIVNQLCTARLSRGIDVTGMEKRRRCSSFLEETVVLHSTSLAADSLI